jgi:hypothetical protein
MARVKEISPSKKMVRDRVRKGQRKGQEWSGQRQVRRMIKHKMVEWAGSWFEQGGMMKGEVGSFVEMSQGREGREGSDGSEGSESRDGSEGS